MTETGLKEVSRKVSRIVEVFDWTSHAGKALGLG
jgi:hypothetical protein